MNLALSPADEMTVVRMVHICGDNYATKPRVSVSDGGSRRWPAPVWEAVPYGGFFVEVHGRITSLVVVWS